MKLTDQEQVVLKAIQAVGRSGLASIASVVKAVGYPKATTKKALISLSNKGAVSLHRHDWPSSLKPERRKLMVKIGRDYYGAVSVRERNPMGKSKSKGKTALKKTGRALKGFAKGALSAGSEILGAGAMALNPKDVVYKTEIQNDRFRVFVKGHPQNNSGWIKYNSHSEPIRSTAEAKREAAEFIKQVRAGVLPLRNPSRRLKVRNKYIDLVIKGQAKKTPQGWKVGRKTFAQGRGTVNVSSGYYLDRHTGMVYAKRQRNAEKKDSDHPIEVTKHWRAGPPGYLTPWQRAHAAGQSQLFETGIKPAKRRNASKKSKGKKNASRAIATSRKKAPSRARAVSQTRASSRRRPTTKTRKAPTKRATRNPSPESIRKKFAGSVSGSRDLFFPQGTPTGLAKLGKLVLIQTEQGTIKPVNGTAWLCADTKERLHIGSTSNTPLFDGPARNLGKVTKVEYESSKPHLGYKGPIIWFHHMGERGGTRPTLHADGKGGLKFKGGNYKLTTRGIEH